MAKKKNKVITASIPEEMDNFIKILQEEMSKKANVKISKSQVVTLMLSVAIDTMTMHPQDKGGNA